MEVLDSAERAPRPRPQLTRPARLTAAALAIVAIGQAFALTEDRQLPSDVELAAQEGGYSVASSVDPRAVTFQLDSTGRPVDLLGVRAEVPGLRLVDVVAAGTATRGRQLGSGSAPLPEFRLAESVTMTLRFEVTDCDAVDAGRYPVLLQLESGRRAGDFPLALRDYPDLTGNEGPDLRWQQVLALAACGD